MYRFTLFLLAFTSVGLAGTNTYIVSGTGDGYRGAQSFTESHFTFTFTVDTSSITHSTPCCASVYTTPSGTAASVELAGFPAATLAGDQAIFVNNATSTAGIWHYNDPEYLTVTNSRFATNDLSVPFGGYSITGEAYSYATPMALSTGDTLYFTSVHDVAFSARPVNGGPPSAVSVTPSSGPVHTDATQTFTFVVSDDAGATDIQGIDILLRDPPAAPNACWLYYEAATSTMTVNQQDNWSAPVPIGASGSALNGDACFVDTRGVTVSSSGNHLSLAVPLRISFADNKTWPILLNAVNNQNVSSGYQQAGTLTAEDPSASSFVLFVDPGAPRGIPLGSSLKYSVNVQPVGGFNQTITFSGTSAPKHSGNSSRLSFTFDPPALTGSGTTYMTVSTATSDTPDIYDIEVTGTSQSVTSSSGAGAVEASNVPPVVSISPNTGTGSTQTFAIQMTDRIDIAGMNLLIAPALDGKSACWIYFDRAAVYLASDDGAVWTKAGAGTSNSQCAINPDGASYDDGSKTLRIAITFKPAFAGTKSLFVRASNYAGFETGYRALGGWTVQ